MSFETFKDLIETAIQEKIGDEAEVKVSEVLKPNGTMLAGLQVRYNEQRVAPVVYLNEIYKEYEAGKSDFETLIDELLRFITENKCVSDAMIAFVDQVSVWDNIKDRVYPMLLSTELNEELVEDYPSKDYLDLSIVYYIRGECTDDCNSTIRISNDLFNSYNIGIEELHNQALSNMKKDGYTIRSMAEVLRELLSVDEEEILADLLEADQKTMMVMSNENKNYGAAGILNSELMEEKLGGQSAYLIPSSIHEWIIITDDGNVKSTDLDEMVTEVNATQVKPEEVLSTHSYYYDGETKTIRISA